MRPFKVKVNVPGRRRPILLTTVANSRDEAVTLARAYITRKQRVFIQPGNHTRH